MHQSTMYSDSHTFNFFYTVIQYYATMFAAHFTVWSLMCVPMVTKVGVGGVGTPVQWHPGTPPLPQKQCHYDNSESESSTESKDQRHEKGEEGHTFLEPELQEMRRTKCFIWRILLFFWRVPLMCYVQLFFSSFFSFLVLVTFGQWNW